MSIIQCKIETFFHKYDYCTTQTKAKSKVTKAKAKAKPNAKTMTDPVCIGFNDLYESVSEDFPDIGEDNLKRYVVELYEVGLLVRDRNYGTDDYMYRGCPGLKYSDFSSIDNSMKQHIMFHFVDNPTVFFVLYNTQKGKSRIVQTEVLDWVKVKSKQIVPILLQDNDTTLADQTVLGLIRALKENNVKYQLFELSSTSKITSTVQNIISAINSFACFPDEEPMPIVSGLTNNTQIQKILTILQHIRHRRTKCPNLMAGMIWDEADKTYPSVRDKKFQVDNETLCIRNFTLDDTSCLYHIGFVTATEGSLIEDFPECATAYNFKPEQNELDTPYYRAIHQHTTNADVKVGLLPDTYKQKKNNNGFKELLRENLEYFMNPIPGTNAIYRKTIVNADNNLASQHMHAVEMHAEGCHVLVFNRTGLTVYQRGVQKTERFKTKGCTFNVLLFYVYKLYELHTAPLFIMGRKKVDRGLGFHYAPRQYNGIAPKTENFEKKGDIVFDGVEGLIWTDMFLGHIEAKQSAVQKAGRLSGIVAQCPQYVSITFWTTASTARMVCDHYSLVDATNSLVGCHTIEQSIEHAKREIVPSTFVDIREPADPRQTVPIVIDELSAEDISALARRGNVRRETVKSIIARTNQALLDEIERDAYKFCQITTPDVDGSYKKHVIDAMTHVVNKTGFDIDFSKEQKTKNSVNVYIDRRESRLIIVRWKGA